MTGSLYTHQSENIRRTWYLMTTFFIVVIAIGWAVGFYLNNPAIVIGAVIFAIAMNVFSYWKSDSLVVAMTGAKPADERVHRELHRMVENLAITAGLPKPKVYIVEDLAPNAFATGRNPEHSLVAVTTGLLQILDRTELEGVIAHELAHIGNRDMLVGTVAVVLAGFIAVLGDFFLRAQFYGFGNNRDNRAGAAILVVGILLAILAPIAAKMIQMAISRKREFLADATGAMLTRYPEGLASALEKISSHGRPMQRQSNATAHLFISNPFGKEGSSIASSISKLFMTHPPTGERIAALRDMDVK